jgi:hypothetical protein
LPVEVNQYVKGGHVAHNGGEGKFNQYVKGGHVAHNGGEGKCTRSFDRESLRKQTSWMYNTEIGWNGVDWINLVQNGVKWQAVVNTVIDLTVSFLTS